MADLRARAEALYRLSVDPGATDNEAAVARQKLESLLEAHPEIVGFQDKQQAQAAYEQAQTSPYPFRSEEERRIYTEIFRRAAEEHFRRRSAFTGFAEAASNGTAQSFREALRKAVHDAVSGSGHGEAYYYTHGHWEQDTDWEG